MRRNILEDKSLNELDIIPEIDTLDIINLAEKVIKQKEIKKINAMGIISCILILMFNLLIIIIGGIKIFLIIQGFVIWISPLMILVIIKYFNRRII